MGIRKGWNRKRINRSYFYSPSQQAHDFRIFLGFVALFGVLVGYSFSRPVVIFLFSLYFFWLLQWRIKLARERFAREKRRWQTFSTSAYHKAKNEIFYWENRKTGKIFSKLIKDKPPSAELYKLVEDYEKTEREKQKAIKKENVIAKKTIRLDIPPSQRTRESFISWLEHMKFRRPELVNDNCQNAIESENPADLPGTVLRAWIKGGHYEYDPDLLKAWKILARTKTDWSGREMIWWWLLVKLVWPSISFHRQWPFSQDFMGAYAARR